MAVPSRLSGSLPVSIAVHLAALVLLFVIPLTAEVALPLPPSTIDSFIRAVPAPPPPPAPRVRTAGAAVSNEPRVPTTAPDAIVPERARELVDPRPAVEGGVPFDGSGIGGLPILESPVPVPPPPAAPPPADPVRVGELLRPPVRTVDVRPEYPAIARAARVEGSVILEAVIDRSGRVTRLRVVRSVPLLDQAAIEAVRRWQYTPSTLHGVPVDVLMTITVTFTLQP